MSDGERGRYALALSDGEIAYGQRNLVEPTAHLLDEIAIAFGRFE